MKPQFDYREILAPYAWKHPQDYGGFSPDGDYVIVTQTRDSDAAVRSNYRRIYADLHATPFDGNFGCAASSTRPAVYDWRAGHWACGWVEYLMVRHDAPEVLLVEAAKILCALANYPVYDESDASELEFNETCDYWKQMRVRDRYEAIVASRSTVSIFAARRAELPSDENGALFDYLRG